MSFILKSSHFLAILTVLWFQFKVIHNTSPTSGIYHIVSRKHPNLTFDNFIHQFCRPHFRSKQLEICRNHNALMVSIVSGYKQALIHCQQLFKHNRWNCGGHNITVINDKENYGKKKRNIPPESTVPGMRSYIDQLTRKTIMESAFVHSLSSASVAHYITQTCSQGKVDSCGCDITAANNAPIPNWKEVQVEYYHKENRNSNEQKNQQRQSHQPPVSESLNKQMLMQNSRTKSFRWAGCSDNVHFGTAFARDFLLSPYLNLLRKKFDPDMHQKKERRLKNKQKQAMIHMHNLNVGTQVLIDSMTVKCKCHGVSGSCDTKTCWRSLPNIEHVANKLYRKYADAVRVRVSLSPRMLIPYFYSYMQNPPSTYKVYRSPRSIIESTSSMASDSLLKKLVYSKSSPSFCKHNVKYGSIGTYGRSCNVTKEAPNSCHNICCSRGYISQRKIVTVDCNCKFIWCCEVKCNKCQKEVIFANCR